MKCLSKTLELVEVDELSFIERAASVSPEMWQQIETARLKHHNELLQRINAANKELIGLLDCEIAELSETKKARWLIPMAACLSASFFLVSIGAAYAF